jgi:hypothetical protein
MHKVAMSTSLQVNYVRVVSIVGVLMIIGWIVGLFTGAGFFNWTLLASIMAGVIFVMSFVEPDLCKSACLALGFVLGARAVSLFVMNDSFIWVGIYGLIGIVSFVLYFKKGDEYVAPLVQAPQQVPPAQ